MDLLLYCWGSAEGLCGLALALGCLLGVWGCFCWSCWGCCWESAGSWGSTLLCCFGLLGRCVGWSCFFWMGAAFCCLRFCWLDAAGLGGTLR